MQERVFYPNPQGGNIDWLKAILLFSVFYLVVVFAVADDAASRWLFSVFAACFLGGAYGMYRLAVKKNIFPLFFDEKAIQYAPFMATYGIVAVPWREIASIDIFYGSYGMGHKGPRWLMIRLKPGKFRDAFQTPASEKILGGDVNLVMNFDTKDEEILASARDFLRMFGSV